MRRVREALLGVTLALGGIFVALPPLEASPRVPGYGSSGFLVRDARPGWFHQPYAKGRFGNICFRENGAW